MFQVDESSYKLQTPSQFFLFKKKKKNKRSNWKGYEVLIKGMLY